MDSMRYSHTQIGWVMLITLGLGIVFIIYVHMSVGFNWVSMAVLAMLAIFLVLFSTLTIVCDGRTLEVRFGPGLIRKRFPLKDIESYRAVKNPWYYGWGIRRTPHGWLFNVSGVHALEIQMRDGRKYRIGTDDPNGLIRYMERYR